MSLSGTILMLPRRPRRRCLLSGGDVVILRIESEFFCLVSLYSLSPSFFKGTIKLIRQCRESIVAIMILGGTVVRSYLLLCDGGVSVQLVILAFDRLTLEPG